MEERLLIAGLLMAGYSWAARKGKALVKPAVLHAAFFGGAVFSAWLVAAASLSDEARLGTDVVRSVIAGAVAAALGFAYASFANAQRRPALVEDDLEWSDTVYSAALLACVIMYFVIQAFKIPSGSMESTLLIGDHVFVNKFIYGLRVPETGRRVFPLRDVRRGDVIVFQFPTDDPNAEHCGTIEYGNDLIKRVVGLPGDVIQVKDGQLIRNGKPVGEEPYAQYLDGPMRQPASVLAASLGADRYQQLWQSHELDHELQDVQRDSFGPVTVPPQAYFVMGDNRDRSCDSRYWGPVERRYLKGKAWLIYWPPSRMRAL